ncbi:MAG: UDP-2,3-diacylglucosamine diphosphatase LpxI [Pseudomonadota bacterium]
MPETAGPAGLLAIIAGRGDLPRLIAERRRDAAQPYILVVFQECWDEWMQAHPHQHHKFEKIGAMFRALRHEGATHVVFAGAMNRPRLQLWKLDLKAAKIAAKALALLRKGDDEMLRGYAKIIEDEGLTMIGPHEVMGDSMTVGAGALGQKRPSAIDLKDAALAAQIVHTLGPLDVGQGAVVARGVCLAVEAIEGTDLMLARLADLPVERRASAPPPSGVLFKGLKPGQDRRMDLPTIGPSTVEGAVAAGLNGIVVAAGETMLMEEAATRQAADRAGIFVYGANQEDLAGQENG